MLINDNRAMRQAGCKLAEAALRVIREYDGLHRLALAVTEWSRVVSCEGRRGAPKEEYGAVDLQQPTGQAGSHSQITS